MSAWECIRCHRINAPQTAFCACGPDTKGPMVLPPPPPVPNSIPYGGYPPVKPNSIPYPGHAGRWWGVIPTCAPAPYVPSSGVYIGPSITTTVGSCAETTLAGITFSAAA
jgi:hypothetical protein